MSHHPQEAVREPIPIDSLVRSLFTNTKHIAQAFFSRVRFFWLVPRITASRPPILPIFSLFIRAKPGGQGGFPYLGFAARRNTQPGMPDSSFPGLGLSDTVATAVAPPPSTMAASTAPAADSGMDKLVDLIQRFVETVAEVSERLPFHIDREKFHSFTTLAALVIAIVFAWKLLRSPSNHQRRRRKRPGPLPAHGNASSRTDIMVQSSEACTSSGDLKVQDVIDEFFQPVKLTLGQLVRQKLREGRKVTCRLLGVILEETSPEELQKHATVRSSVLEVLLEITKYCDLYLMERILDDESQERVLSALKDAGVFMSGGLISDKVLFCSTENGRSSFVRQLESDWHIDSNPEVIFHLARFIKYELYISPKRPECTASNVFTSTSLEQFFGVSS